MALDA